ncbi:MAG: EAL domain-containing protein [Lachnospiraceae bacterium]|nr:EAL domain-containing protein [Lachnospiraceae bacterium]
MAVSKKEQRLKKLKKGNAWSGMVALIFVTVILAVLLLVLFESILFYILKGNLRSEKERITTIANLYEMGKSDEEIHSFLGGDIREYVIKDKAGKTLAVSGRDTMSDESFEVTVSSGFREMEGSPEEGEIPGKGAGPADAVKPGEDAKPAEKAKAGDKEKPGIDVSVGNPADVGVVVSTESNRDNDTYTEDMFMIISGENATIRKDKEKPFFYGSDESLALDLKQLNKWLKKNGGFFDDKRFVTGEITFDLPYWIEMPLKDDGKIMYGKALYQITFDDFLFVGSLIAVTGFLLVILLLTIVLSLIKGVRRQAKMNAVFYMDEVTGGHNWMWFLIKGGAFLRKRKNDKYNFAVLDLVFVNYRNYCMCHSVAAGEKLLSRVDAIVKKELDKRCETISHYASANFAVLMKYGTKEELTERINRLITLLQDLDSSLNFNFHVGVNPLPAKTDERGKLIRRKKLDVDEEYNNACTARSTLSDHDSSDIAFFDEELIAEQKWRSQVQEEQKAALENEEFLVYYQPKYNPVTNTLSGAEALIRWNSSKYGFQPPGRFIPIFEKNGFITKIDHYMIRHVAADQKKWLDEGYECVPVSVNVSRAHFSENDLAEQVRDMVDEVGTPHDLIEIELTESAFFDDKKAIIHTIQSLKEYGFSVSMDDFGSGYSSLNSLKDMPLDVLKLDAEFFRGEDAGQRGEIVVREALRLAKELHMKTVAEGVEVKEQVDFLADQGCDMIQGYYFAKPEPADDYTKRMKHTE